MYNENNVTQPYKFHWWFIEIYKTTAENMVSGLPCSRTEKFLSLIFDGTSFEIFDIFHENCEV